ncbi:MAG: hypothetical protein WBX25_08935 [Rhodomicrobium sp.]
MPWSNECDEKDANKQQADQRQVEVQVAGLDYAQAHRRATHESHERLKKIRPEYRRDIMSEDELPSSSINSKFDHARQGYENGTFSTTSLAVSVGCVIQGLLITGNNRYGNTIVTEGGVKSNRQLLLNAAMSVQ